MYIIAIPDKGNFNTNNIGTFHIMREFLIQQSVKFRAFYDNGEECFIREEATHTNRTFSNVDHKPLIRLSAGLGMRDEMIEFLVQHAGKHRGSIVTH